MQNERRRVRERVKNGGARKIRLVGILFRGSESGEGREQMTADSDGKGV